MTSNKYLSVVEFLVASKSLPASLHSDSTAAVAAVQAVGNWPDSLDIKLLDFACTGSPWLARIVEQNPVAFCALLERYVDELPGFEELRSTLGGIAVDMADGVEVCQRILREFRHLHLALIGFHDLSGLSPVDSVLRCLSDLADACLTHALEAAEFTCQQRFGIPRDDDGAPLSLIVIGMGKLGGRELNFSSDVDLVFLYRCHGTTSGGRKEMDNQEYFRRVGQLLIKLLDEVTADGFVYRVDMRLRPFGSSGPLVVGLEGLENYLLTQGRDWERYAWIKSRVICGHKDDARVVTDLLRPFIYRRYLDYAVFESLRDLKRQIGVKLQKSGERKDVKLGQGGIREIEFIAQSFQLVRGGREPVLQKRGLRTVIEQLGVLGHFNDADGSGLLQAYDFLRRVENRLQMVDDRQTHLLPGDEVAKQRLAMSMCFNTFREFEEKLAQHNEFVHQCFVSVFSVTEPSDKPGVFENIWLQIRSASDHPQSDVVATLSELGCNDAEATATMLHEFTQSGRYHRYLNRSRDLIDKLVPKALELTFTGSQPHSETLNRVLALYHAVSGRVGYLQLLTDSSSTLKNLVLLFSQSPWLANFVTNHPMVLDELLDIEQGSSVLTVVQNIAALNAELLHHEDADLGEVMDMVRHFQQSRIVRIAAADINDRLPVMKVSDGLSWLAESVLQAATSIVQADMEKRHGLPQCIVDGHKLRPEFAIVAYGKLGGIELGYGSDLDIVFVHESSGSNQQSDGQKPLENQVYFSRMAQKLVHFLSTLTAAGVLYEVDTRLRPNGRSGVLVIGIDAFAEYQRREAWTWEHQALVRARVVVGDDRLCRRFSEIRRSVLGQKPDSDVLLNDVTNMRALMRTELANEDGGTFDLKQGLGGIADIEFMVQYLVLKYACENEALLDFTDNVRQIECLQKYGFLQSQDAKTLTDAYLYCRGRLHRRSLLEDTGTITIDEHSNVHREAISGCWQKLMESKIE